MYSLHLTHPKWTHTRSSGQPCYSARGAVGGSVPCSRTPRSWYWTPPTNNPCRTWDSNPQPSAYKSDSLSIRPRLPRSDNGTEFMSRDFQALLTKNKIRHETSAPYSPHQNGTAERGWRTLYDMSRCLLIESELPDELWNYAMQTSAYVRNRCYCRRTKETPYELFTGRKPDVSKMQKFGSICLPTNKRK